MFINVTPVEDTDVGFFRSKYVEIEQDVPIDAKFLRMNLPGHSKPRKVRVEATTDFNVVRVINNTNIMVQLRTYRTFAVFKPFDELVVELADELSVTPDELLEHAVESVGGTATFYASELTFDDYIGTLNITPLVVRVLVDAGIQSVPELRAMTEEDLLSIQSIGPVTLDMINKALAEHDGT